MSKLKLLEIIPSLGNGGAEKLVYDICMRIDLEIFSVTLLLFYEDCNPKYYEPLIKKGIKISILNKKLGFDFSMFLKLSRFIGNFNPDIIHSHLSVNLYLFPYYLFHKKQIGFHTVHNLAEKELPSKIITIMKYLYRKRMVKPVAISQIVAESIRKVYNVENFPIIYNGVDTRLFKNSNNRVDNNLIYFIAVGRLAKQKNYQLMFRAVAKVVQEFNNIRLIVLGDGELKQEIENLIISLNMEQNIFLSGNVDNVQEFLSTSNCFLMSSDYEGMPLSVLEAMASGLPIIATRAGGVVDVVIDGVNGYLCDVKDQVAFENCILKFLKSNNYKSFAQKSLQLSHEYDINKCLEKYVQTFREALKK